MMTLEIGCVCGQLISNTLTSLDQTDTHRFGQNASLDFLSICSRSPSTPECAWDVLVFEKFSSLSGCCQKMGKDQWEGLTTITTTKSSIQSKGKKPTSCQNDREKVIGRKQLGSILTVKLDWRSNAPHTRMQWNWNTCTQENVRALNALSWHNLYINQYANKVLEEMFHFLYTLIKSDLRVSRPTSYTRIYFEFFKLKCQLKSVQTL